MNLLCPHCQRLLTVPDEKAGQITNCPLCQQAFPVPSLPQTATTSPAGSRRAAPPPVPPQGDAGADVFALAPVPPAEPPGRVAMSPPREEQQPIRSKPLSTPKAPPPPPPGDYQHTYSIWISPQVVPLIAPMALALVFILMFFPWTGSFPGGRPVYTQTLFQAIAGTFTTDAVGDRVLNLSADISKYIRIDWLTILYFVLWLLALVVTVAPVFMRNKPFDLPPAFQQIWPWRSMLSVAICILVLVVLLADARGFGLENALTRKIDETLQDQRPAQPTDEETAKWNIQRGAELGKLHLHRTSWFRLAELFHLLAIAGVGLEFWLERRGSRPSPRIDLRW